MNISFEQSLVGLVFSCDVTPEKRKAIFDLNHRSGVYHVGLEWKNRRVWYEWK
jgi:hypothetical protein